MKASWRTPPWAYALWFMAWGAGLIIIFSGTAFTRANLELEGTVVSSVRTKDPSGPYRYYQDYVIDPGGGKSQVTYRAGYNDAALSRDIPVGARLRKNRWQLDYEVDGREIGDFPIGAYVGIVGFGCVGLATGMFLLFRRPWRPSASSQAADEFFCRGA